MYFNPLVFDEGLDGVQSNVNELHILEQEIGVWDYSLLATYTLGKKTNPTINNPEEADDSLGRKVSMAAITDGEVTKTGLATHFAWVNTTASEVLVTGELSASQSVTDGNPFSLELHNVTLPTSYTEIPVIT